MFYPQARKRRPAAFTGAALSRPVFRLAGLFPGRFGAWMTQRSSVCLSVCRGLALQRLIRILAAFHGIAAPSFADKFTADREAPLMSVQTGNL